MDSFLEFSFLLSYFQTFHLYESRKKTQHVNPSFDITLVSIFSTYLNANNTQKLVYMYVASKYVIVATNAKWQIA